MINEDDLINEKQDVEANLEQNHLHVPDFPWFGLDIGGTLVKLLN